LTEKEYSTAEKLGFAKITLILVKNTSGKYFHASRVAVSIMEDINPAAK